MKTIKINIDENKIENLAENDNKPFVNMENIDNMPQIKEDNNKELDLENNISKKPSEIVADEESVSMSSNTESESYSKREERELLRKNKELYEESKRKLEPYQFNMLNTIKNIEEMVRTGERQRNYKIKSEFEREKEYKLEEQDELKNKILELSKSNINEKLINHFNIILHYHLLI